MSEDVTRNLPPIHPGEILREDVLPETGLTKKAFAERLGMSRLALHNVLEGKSAVSTILALKLARFLGTSPQVWLNLQQSYDIALTSKQRSEEIERVSALEAA